MWDKDANENLSDLQLENTLSSGLISDFKLVAQPVISSNHFHILLSGCVYRPDHYDCPSYHVRKLCTALVFTASGKPPSYSYQDYFNRPQ